MVTVGVPLEAIVTAKSCVAVLVTVICTSGITAPCWS